MTQEDKELLLKDLCARLPYGVKVTWDGKYPLTVTPYIYCAITSENNINNLPKLLLRPMSSMTKSELKKLDEFMRIYSYNIFHKLSVFRQTQDYLNSIHIDYHGLIEKGLALEATEGMYN